MTRTAQYQSSELGLTPQRKAEIIAREKHLAQLLWEGFKQLGEEFEIWLLLAVSGVMVEKQGDEEATLREIAQTIQESGVLKVLGLKPPLKFLEHALGFLRRNPEIVPPERRAYLRQVSRDRNLVLASEASKRTLPARLIENRIGGAGVLWEIMAHGEAWWPDGRPNVEHVRAQLQTLGVDMSKASAAKWLRKMLKRPEAEDIKRQDIRMQWNEETDQILREILREKGARNKEGLRSIEYLIERFWMETNLRLSESQMKNHLVDFSE